jgi:hypothetical protein
MIRILGLVAALGALAACGVDGEPERPQPGIKGEARFGVVLN